MHAYFVLRMPEELQVFSVLASSDLARHGCFHRNFQLFQCVLNAFVELFIFRIDETGTSCIVELRFLDGPLMLFLFVELRLTSSPYFWPQVIWPGCCFPFCQPFSQTL